MKAEIALNFEYGTDEAYVQEIENQINQKCDGVGASINVDHGQNEGVMRLDFDGRPEPSYVWDIKELINHRFETVQAEIESIPR